MVLQRNDVTLNKELTINRMKKTIIMMLLSVATLTANKVIAAEPVSPEPKVYDVVEKMPSFPGGSEALKEYLKKNTMYPNPDACITGRVVVVFVVDEKGNVGDVKVARSVEPSFDAEAVRVVKAMPRWNPGIEKGKAVKVRYTLPVTFRLQ